MDIVFELGKTKFQNLKLQQQFALTECTISLLITEVAGKSSEKNYKNTYNEDIYLRSN